MKTPTPNGAEIPDQQTTSKTHLFPASPSADLVFDDGVLDEVESVWKRVTEGDDNGDVSQFLVFEDREGQGDEDEDYT